MFKPGLSYADTGDVKPFINDDGEIELEFVICFRIFMLPDDQLAHFGTTFEKIWKHERRHIKMVSSWVKIDLGRIERAYKKEIISDPENALDNAKNRFDKAVTFQEWVSQLILSEGIRDVIERYNTYVSEINDFWVPWQNDEFMVWAMRI